MRGVNGLYNGGVSSLKRPIFFPEAPILARVERKIERLQQSIYLLDLQQLNVKDKRAIRWNAG